VIYDRLTAGASARSKWEFVTRGWNKNNMPNFASRSTHILYLAYMFFFMTASCFPLFLESALVPTGRYKLYCMYTPEYETLFREYFLQSLKDDFEIVVSVYPQDCPSGTFRSDGWEKTMLYKLELLQKAVLDNWGDQIFFYSDVDIIFLKPTIEISLTLLGDNDFVVQQGWPRNRLCAGFFVMRGNEKTLKLITTAHTLLKEKICVDDQVAIQAVLDDFKHDDIAWQFLPSEQFPNGRRVLKQASGHYSEDSEIEIDKSIIIFHANCCIGLENKYNFLLRVQQLLDIL
jgi:hypothetical protein